MKHNRGFLSNLGKRDGALADLESASTVKSGKDYNGPGVVLQRIKRTEAE